ncbi:MAG: hypothetical protein QF530_11530 [SAR202 cluster bacterium]|nr:hypothetical protein [SAR202 cluster bacterium]
MVRTLGAHGNDDPTGCYQIVFPTQKPSEQRFYDRFPSISKPLDGFPLDATKTDPWNRVLTT